MFAVILDDLVAFTCIPRIFEGSELVLLGAGVACTGFTKALLRHPYLKRAVGDFLGGSLGNSG